MNLTGKRSTRETTVELDLSTDGPEPTVELAWTHHGGLDESLDEGMARHLYHTLLRYARLGGTLRAEGDLAHHVVEDTALTLGKALGEHAEDQAVQRYAERTVAMDEALVQVVLDAGGRPFYVSDLDEVSPLWDHVLRSMAFEARFTLHVRLLRGLDPHHAVEAALKATGMALHQALSPADRLESTKGRVQEG